jgi:predicted DNA-binding transcriptional regulator AlpA
MGILEEIRDQNASIIQGQKQLLQELERHELAQEWYDLLECCRLKGVALNTIQKRRELQPPNPQRTGRRIRWHRSEVAEWLRWNDQECQQHWEERRSRSGAVA